MAKKLACICKQSWVQLMNKPGSRLAFRFIKSKINRNRLYKRLDEQRMEFHVRLTGRFVTLLPRMCSVGWGRMGFSYYFRYIFFVLPISCQWNTMEPKVKRKKNAYWPDLKKVLTNRLKLCWVKLLNCKEPFAII